MVKKVVVDVVGLMNSRSIIFGEAGSEKIKWKQELYKVFKLSPLDRCRLEI
jgi:hypothetical protein